MSGDMPWPRKGDILFEPGEDLWHNACVGWSRDQWIGYREGYKLGADLLFQHVAETRSKQDFLVYPIVFLYRQALEVALKHLLIQGRELLDQDEKLPNKHRLVPLWQSCRKILEHVWPGGPKQDLDAVTEVIEQFDEKDPGSFVFRYPVDTDGNTVHAKHELIDLRNLSEVVNRVYSLLDAAQCGISEYKEWKSDMIRDAM